ncbi:MAG TPA: DUF5700 domain-containing putative Zn-dependent protease [Pyrinomonadaceae bacterium]|nr:DUF5700 domain-containing putative Zn-dependent protease [Pyrinomonadaceae bacterium]
MRFNFVSVVLRFFLLLLAIGFPQVAITQSSSINKVNVRVVTDEADAVLEILAKREAGKQVTEADWQRVFKSEGYIRLKQREHSLARSFEHADFKAFVLSDSLVKKRKALAETLAEWKQTNVEKIALRPLAYLPSNAQIRATIYPVIKPRDNSFVFDLSGSPAVFLYLDPSKSRAVFENSFAHELHHIGYGTACPTTTAREALVKTQPGSQKVLKWIGAFGEGLAMLAAAGGVDMHPHATSSAEDKLRWDRDVANFDTDLRTVEKFFLDLSKGTLSEEQETKTGYSFFGVQGPWYTVGWQMAVVIEKTFGRATLIESFCDQQKLLPTYNKAVRKYNRKHRTRLASWSNELLNELK